MFGLLFPFIVHAYHIESFTFYIYLHVRTLSLSLTNLSGEDYLQHLFNTEAENNTEEEYADDAFESG